MLLINKRWLSLGLIIFSLETACKSQSGSDNSLAGDLSPGIASDRNEDSKAFPWRRWDQVSAELLAESSLPQNQGEPTIRTHLLAIDFCLASRDYTRVEWLNSRFLNSQDPRLQALGLFNLGRMQAKLDNFDRAEEAWQKALQIDPANTQIQRSMGLLYAQFGFFSKSLLLLKPFEDEPLIAITLVSLERQLGLNEQADRRCELLLKLAQPLAEAYFNCSLLEFQNHRNAVKAIGWMGEAQRSAAPQSQLALDAQKQLILMQEWKARFQSNR